MTFLVVVLFTLSLILLITVVVRFRAHLRARLRHEVQQRELIRLSHSAQEQEAWRREQLCRVAAILTSHNVALEGLPLATQVAGQRAVLTDRQPRGARRSEAQFLLQADGTLGTVAQIAAAARAGGPPPDALPGVDILQLFISWMTRRRRRPLPERFMREAFSTPVDAQRSGPPLRSAADVYGPGETYIPRDETDRTVLFVVVSDSSEEENSLEDRNETEVVTFGNSTSRYTQSEATPVVWLQKSAVSITAVEGPSASPGSTPRKGGCWFREDQSQYEDRTNATCVSSRLRSQDVCV